MSDARPGIEISTEAYDRLMGHVRAAQKAKAEGDNAAVDLYAAEFNRVFNEEVLPEPEWAGDPFPPLTRRERFADWLRDLADRLDPPPERSR